MVSPLLRRTLPSSCYEFIRTAERQEHIDGQKLKHHRVGTDYEPSSRAASSALKSDDEVYPFSGARTALVQSVSANQSETGCRCKWGRSGVENCAGLAERSHTQFSLLLPARTAVPWPEGLDALAERTSTYSQSLASFVYKRNPVECWIVSRTRVNLVPARGVTSHLVQLWLPQLGWTYSRFGCFLSARWTISDPSIRSTSRIHP